MELKEGDPLAKTAGGSEESRKTVFRKLALVRQNGGRGEGGGG